MKRLPADTRARAKAGIRALAGEPRPQGVRKLEGADDLWRIRVGEYRVIFSIDDDARTVVVEAVGHRRDVYRGR